MCECSVENCHNKVVAKGLCSKHYTQLRRYGKIFKYSKSDKTNHIEILEDHAEIFLIDKNNEVCAKALIDLDDVDKVKNIKWHRSELQRSTYYCLSNDSEWKRIHRLIMGVTDKNTIVDHINHNGLDNRKSNLRVCTSGKNICNCLTPKNNKSGHKGVYWSKEREKWCAQISVNNKTKSLGRYDTIEEAIEAREKAAKEYYGEFANEN